jgi:hypothetical protein
MRKCLLVVLVAAAACSPSETGDSTTTSSSLGFTTTTGGVTTTTTAPPATTTTTSPATTTTTLPASTTTAALLEGEWADGPLVTTAFGALGWWDGADWLDAETEGALPVVGGEDYQVTRLGELARTTAGPQTTVCEPLELIGVELADPGLLGEFPGPYGVAVSAPWTLQPHLVEEIPDDGTYSGFAADLLSSRGLDVATPVIKQVLRTDLEGDGVNEVLVVAEEVSPGFLMEPGDYSIAFMRKVVDGEVQTAVLGETIAMDEDDRFAGAHTLGGAADLNGDGKMEIITNSAFFEGFNVTVWEYPNDDLGPLLVLQTGCGV